MTLQGEHNEGNPFNNDAFMYGGIGKVKLAAGSQTKWIGKNTRFTKQFRGTSGNKTPFKLVVTDASGDKDHTVTKVISDTELHTATSDFGGFDGRLRSVFSGHAEGHGRAQVRPRDGGGGDAQLRNQGAAHDRVRGHHV